MSDSRPFAKVTIEVLVSVEWDDGSYWDAPEQYLVAREAEMTKVEFFEDPGLGIIAEYGAADDLDCDSAIVDAVRGALIPTETEPEVTELGEFQL